MGRLEGHVENKEREFYELERVVVAEFMKGKLTERQLRQALKKSFMLGHSVGHLRGEIYTEKLWIELGGANL